MLINFTVSNFLSFDEKQTFSMEGGKARKHSKRLYKDSHVKLTKCKAVFGANASGKSNLTKAFEFVQDIILDKMPIGFTTKYFRLIRSFHQHLKLSYYCQENGLFMVFLFYLKPE